MTTVLRPYINYEYIQKVDDGCLEYKSIPMAVVNKLIKVEHAKNDFTGIKQIYNLIPPRPKNINAMATSIARINNFSYSVAVPSITKKFADEEVAAVRTFVANGSGFLSLDPEETTGGYVPETPVMSSSGQRLVPSARRPPAIFGTRMVSKEEVSFILGNFDETSGVVPLNPSMEAQTEWQATQNQLLGFDKDGNPISELFEYGQKFKKDFGNTKTFIESFPAGSGLIESGYRKGEMGSFREGLAAQSRLTKPPAGSNMTVDAGVYETYLGTPGSSVQYVVKEQQTFIQDPTNRQGTFQGTPDRHRNRADRIKGVQQMLGQTHTSKRSGLESGGHSDFPSGGETPVGPLDRGRKLEKAPGNRASRGDTPAPSMRN